MLLYSEQTAEKYLLQWLEEDIGYNDITTCSMIGSEVEARAVIHTKENGVACGLAWAKRVFSLLDPEIVAEGFVSDGQKITAGQTMMTVKGSAQAILKGERLALNILQRLSGIATKTDKIVNLAEGFNIKIADTRKTTPGFRLFEKYAVRTGGGYNHRFGLFDGVLIKDNHIKIAGGISQAIRAAREKVPHTLKIEVEVETLPQVKEALNAKADIIMLDNMSIAQMKEAVQLVGGRSLLEASGGIDEFDIKEVAQTGVDYVSLGALTHSVKSLDISLDIE